MRDKEICAAFHKLVAHETNRYYLLDTSAADRARCKAAKAEVLVANEACLVQAQILRGLEHCLLLIAGCVTKTGPEADIGSHSVRLTVSKTFPQIRLSHLIQCTCRATAHAQTAVGAGIILYG